MTAPDAAAPLPPPQEPDTAAAVTPVPRSSPSGPTLAWLAVLSVLALVALGLVWQAQQRLSELEQELVRRQAASSSLAGEAKASAQASAAQVQELAAKLTLAELRLSEVALQRSQLEELLQSFTRSRDENIVGDLEAGLRLAAQQSALVASAEPLIAALRQADERLQRYKQPRLEGVRRAVLRDLERIKAITAVDPGTLALRLDEVARLVDELPLLSEPQRQQRAQAAEAPARPAAAEGAWARWLAGGQTVAAQVWSEAKTLLRVTRIDRPEAMLLAPEQAFFLRENLKLRLLNARLALMSRQYEAARLDLTAAIAAVERHADTRQRRSQLALELLRQVQGQAKPVQWPRPDDSLAALAAAAGVVR
jgi:uroporphyrin-3 C-methyltransferase